MCSRKNATVRCTPLSPAAYSAASSTVTGADGGEAVLAAAEFAGLGGAAADFEVGVVEDLVSGAAAVLLSDLDSMLRLRSEAFTAHTDLH